MTRVDPHGLQQAVDQVVSRQPVVGLAVGVVQAGRLQHFVGHGLADLRSSRPITADTVFRIASITKTFTAVSVLQLNEQGTVDLDAPANDYLHSVRLVPGRAGLGSPSVRHLLTHTAGLGELAHPSGVVRPDFGESVPAGQPLPSLAEFYRGGPRVYAEPGTRFVYNNHGPAVLGQLVEDVTGTPLPHYFREHIFDPLGMADSDAERSDRVRALMASGYEIGFRGVRAVPERDMVTTGAASVYSTPTDMARYLSALLGGGSTEHGSILQPETVAMMVAPQYQPDPRIPGMGLGFFRADLGGHYAVGHQGTHPGFHSQVWLAPEDQVAVMAFTNGGRQPAFWLPAFASRLLASILGAPQTRIRTDVPQRPEAWADLRGWYRLDARPTDTRLRGMMGGGVEVFVRSGRLMMRFLTPIPALARGFVLHPDDPDDPHVFRVDLGDPDMDPMRVVFGQDPSGATARLHLDLMPVTLHKRSSRRRQPQP